MNILGGRSQIVLNGAPQRGTSRTLPHRPHSLKRESRDQDKKTCPDRKFYKKLARAILEDPIPLTDVQIEELEERRRQEKYARQIKMCDGFNERRKL